MTASMPYPGMEVSSDRIVPNPTGGGGGVVPFGDATRLAWLPPLAGVNLARWALRIGPIESERSYR